MLLPILWLCAITLMVIVGVNCWASVRKHQASKKAEVDLKQVELAFPMPEVEKPSANQQALTALLRRRADLEDKINTIRAAASHMQPGYSNDVWKAQRADAMLALEDARTEHRELVQELQLLLKTMGHEDGSQLDPAAQPIRVDTGRPVAQRVDDPSLLHDVEPDQPQAGRAGAA